jgi:hypothetical protein
MRYFLFIGPLLAFVAGCPADPEPGDTEASSGTVDPTTGPDCDTGDCCAVNPNFCPPGHDSSTGLPSTSTIGDDTTTAVTTDTTVATDTTDGEPVCEIGPLLAMLAEGKTEPVDCGTVTLADDTAAWVAASSCAAAAAAATEAFFVAFEQPSIDSYVYDGYYGTVGFVYGLGRLHSDTLGDPMVAAYSCTDVIATPGCAPDVGEHCLECVGASDPMAVVCDG